MKSCEQKMPPTTAVLTGFEPVALRLTVARSNQLSYKTVFPPLAGDGFEPSTFGL